MLNKSAKIITKLQPHQQRALERALLNNLILAHSTGSGKTLTSIAIADALGKPTTVLTPASLVENFKKELKKHKVGGPRVNVVSLPTAVLRDYKVPEGNTLIIDEAHSLRNSGTAKQAYIKKQLENAGRVIALTGTPAYNQVEDWAPLLNIVSKDKAIPGGSSGFHDMFIDQMKIEPDWIDRVFHGVKPGVVEMLKNKHRLRDIADKYVDVFDTDVEKPNKIEEVIRVPMDPEQEETYRYVTKSIPADIRYKIYNNIPPSKKEAGMLNAFLNDVRQVSNTPENYQLNAQPGSKLREAAKRLVQMRADDPNFRALVYSNYLDSGINAYAKLLDKQKIPYSLFTGSLTRKQKQDIVDKYNKGEVPIILGSGSASEGLDLKGTKLIQLLEPHFNNAKTDQVIGRGIRYKSHSHLPPEERNVVVQRYISTLNPQSEWYGVSRRKDTSVDEYLTDMARRKSDLIKQVHEALTGKE